MLPDPLVMNIGRALSTSGGVPSNFRRTAIGKYASTDGAFTSDQPARYSIKPNWKASGPSTYTFTLEMDKNVSPVNGIQQADDTLRCEIRVSGNLRSFTPADFTNIMASNAWTSIENIGRVLVGES